VIIDHNDLAWAIDENIDVWNNGDDTTADLVHDVTFSWNFVYEALKSDLSPSDIESLGILIGGNNNNISLHHNLIAHNDDRSPRIDSIRNAEIVNNLIYNWGGTPSRFDHLVVANLVNNYYRPGPSSSTREVKFDDNINVSGSKIYIAGNHVDVEIDRGLNEGESRFPLEDINAVILQSNTDIADYWFSESPPLFKSSEPAFPLTFTPDSTLDVYNMVINYAGAQNRDATSQRIIDSVENLTGDILESQEDVGGWLSVQSYTAPVDTDKDGMPDEWEIEMGFNPNLDDSRGDHDRDQYTNIEEYINSLIIMP
jgi:pectate lyase